MRAQRERPPLLSDGLGSVGRRSCSCGRGCRKAGEQASGHRSDGLVPRACDSAEECFSLSEPDVPDPTPGLLPSAMESPPLGISNGRDSLIGSSTSAAHSSTGN